MQQVTIDKVKLKSALKKNRKGHRALFEKAMDGYQQAVEDWLTEQLDKARARRSGSPRGPVETYFTGAVPEDHTDDYDRVLEMLEMEVSDTVRLSQSEFKCYVQDQWGWQQNFTATSTAYLAT